MVAIYTGCFFLKYPNAVKVSIARSAPKCFEGHTFRVLAPSPSLLSGYKDGTILEDGYRVRYGVETIDKLDKEAVLSALDDISKGNGDKDVVLCCWEKKGFCHRQLVGGWLGIEEAEPI